MRMRHSLLGLFLMCTGIHGNAQELTSLKEKANLTADQRTIPAGGRVTLTCDVYSADLEYDWWRETSSENKSRLPGESGRVISITKGGTYNCRRLKKGTQSFIEEESDPVIVQETVLAFVKLQPNWHQIFSGETITLRCEIQGGEDKKWNYEWRPPNTNTRPTSSDYKISSVSLSHSGEYSCRGSSKYLLSEWSDAFTLAVSSSKPRATLTPANTELPVGGSVTLRCSVEDSAGWRFDWIRKESVSYKALLDGNGGNGVIRVSRGGLYRCRGWRGDPGFFTYDSSEVTIVETLPNKVTLTLKHDWTQIYRDETVTVRCEIQGGEGTQWTYEWTPAKLNTRQTSSEYRIIRATESDSGEYRCRGRRSYLLTPWSDIITLTVSPAKPKLVLTVSPSWLSPGASVTLKCEAEHLSAGWSFYWYKAVPDLTKNSYSYELLPDGNGTPQDSFIIHEQTHTAGYVCRARRGDPVYYTHYSEPKFVWSADVHSAVSLTVSPDRVQLFISDYVTLKCEGSSSAWRVRKFSEGSPPYYSICRTMTGSTCNIYTSKSDTGVYWCEFGSGEFSNAVNIILHDNPKLVLTVSPSWLSPGASVTLKCEAEHLSAGWSFYWYKAVPDLTKNSYSYELLPDGNGTPQDSFIIHEQTHTAGYVCRARSGDPVYYTHYSEPKFVWSADVHSAASLTVSPDRVQHFTSASVSLKCEGNSSAWRVRKFSEGSLPYYFICRPVTGSTCNIYTSKSDTGVYWCEFGSGEFSNAVNITVHDYHGPILESPAHPVTERESVSLSCSLRGQKTFSTVFFYHNDRRIQNDTRGKLNISAVSKSDEGFYKCEHSGKESPQSWMSVKASVRPESSLSPVSLIVGVVCGISFLIILLLLWCRFRQTKGLCFIRPVGSEMNSQGFTTNHGVSQNETQEYKALRHGASNLYETITYVEGTGNDEHQDVTYSLIELKNIGNRNKSHGSELSAIYTDVKIGTAGKSSPAAANAAVYSEVKLGTSLGL